MELKTTISLAKKGTKSIRTTIPESIGLYLKLVPGQNIIWDMEIIKGKRVCVIKRKENE